MAYLSPANDKPQIFLTFDDGPSEPYTSQILEILKTYEVKATFFVCGKNVEGYPEITRQIAQEGHAIGNHSYSHSRLLTLSGLLRQEIERTDKILKKTAGVETKLFRPPWGIAMPWLKSYLSESGRKLVLWDVMAFDWRPVSAQFIVGRILSKARPETTILLHDGAHGTIRKSRKQTVLALPRLIEMLSERGFIFSKIPD